LNCCVKRTDGSTTEKRQRGPYESEDESESELECSAWWRTETDAFLGGLVHDLMELVLDRKCNV
jgi:hypothetical protein